MPQYQSLRGLRALCALTYLSVELGWKCFSLVLAGLVQWQHVAEEETLAMPCFEGSELVRVRQPCLVPNSREAELHRTGLIQWADVPKGRDLARMGRTLINMWPMPNFKFNYEVEVGVSTSTMAV